MKRFKFSLDSVLSYKQQVLDALKGEHAAILAEVREQEERLEAVRQEYRDCNEEYRQRKAEGIAIMDAKIDTSSIEKLKEKKLDLYNKAVQKSEEVLIDEFVSSARARAQMGA